MKQAILISLDVVLITFVVSFMIAVLIKVLMSGIKYYFRKSAREAERH